MGLSLLQCGRTAAFAAAVILLPACPPEGASNNIVPQAGDPIAPIGQHDMNDYWPMAIGNLWVFKPQIAGAHIEYEVTQYHSNGVVDAWTVLRRFYNTSGLYSTVTFYFVFREDYLVAVEDAGLMLDVMNDPDHPLPEENVWIVAPRYFEESDRPQEFYYSAARQRAFSTMAGPLAPTHDLYFCRDEEYFSSANIPAAADHPVVMIMKDYYCLGVLVPGKMRHFAKGVGPLVDRENVDRGWEYAYILDYAVINGNVYTTN